KSGVIILSVFLLLLTFSGFCQAATEGEKNVCSIEYGGLKININSPIQVYPGENISINISSEAVTQVDIEYIHVTIYGLTNATNEIILANITHLENSSLDFYEASYNVTIPEKISPGLTYGIISCKWDFMGAPQKIPSSGFAMTYVNNVALENLQMEYDELNTIHQSIVQNYTELESDFEEEVGSSRNLVYVFIATTVIAIITVIVLLMRKPKKVWL
ncbi:MAG: hypothetical protein P8Y18_11720, partial [Candidatus Bathyarchaeota archaeon]